MRQSLSARAPEYDTASGEAGFAPSAGEASYESLIAATTASERRAVETAAKTAMALDSVAAWIEQAQGRMAETARVASEAEARTSHVVGDALGSLSQKLVEIERKVETGGTSSVAEALKRIETRLNLSPADADAAPAGGEIQDALRGFEARIANLTERLSVAPRPIGRRGVKPEDEIKAAVAEIRQRQAALDEAPDAALPRPVLGAPERAHAGILLSLRGDIAKLSGQLETVRGPSQAAIDQLAHEMELLRGSVGALPTREDLAAIELSIAGLTGQVGEARSSGRDTAEISARIEALHGSVRDLAESRGGPDSTRLEGDIAALSAKLDGIGADPALRDTMLRELRQIRASVADVAAPAEIAALAQTVSGLRDEVASLAARQFDPHDILEIKASVADVQRILAESPPGSRGGAAVDIASGFRPVETLLHALVDKLDNVERQVVERTSADPASLDAFERQITDLVARVSDNSSRDPAVAHLESAMSSLMGEIATWRDDAFEAAERAARKAVAESLAVAPAAAPAMIEREVEDLKLRYDASERRTEESLAAVNRTLEGVAARIASLSLSATPAGDALREAAAPPEAPTQAQAQAAPAVVGRRREVQPEPRIDPVLADAERPIPAPPQDEVLLEPGAARPKSTKAAAELDFDSADIKSSFIAAARRAAQAAAADSASAKGRAGQRPSDGAASVLESPSGVARRLRAMIDKHRRPLLLSAAALVLALGAFQILGRGSAPAPTAMVEQRAAPALAQSAPAQADPVTTQSISPRAIAAPVEVAPAARPDLPVLPAPAASAAPTPVPSASLSPVTPLPPSGGTKPTTDPAALPAGLKQAALSGNPVAGYEYASRAAEGRGVPKDPQLALKLFEKAAEKGLAPAQYRLGNLFEKGIGTPRDLEAAKTWYRKAAEGGNARAMHNLAVLLAEGSGGKPDYQAAVGWFARAAEHGVRDSQFNLAVLYARGLGTTQDLNKSYAWFAIAAGSGDSDAGKKRDEVGARLAPADLASAKAAVERWRMTPPATAANEVAIPAGGWAEMAAPASTAAIVPKKTGRDSRV